MLSIKSLINYLGILLIISQNCLASDQINYLHFTEIDGLPRNICTSIEQDMFGYMWIGTNNGVARYDGENFYIYDELNGSAIICLLNDSKNNLWVGSDNGLYQLNRLTNSFKLIMEGYIPKLLEYDSEVYFSQTKSIHKINEEKILNVLSRKSITDFCITKNGICVGTMDKGIVQYSWDGDIIEIEDTCLDNNAVSYLTSIEDRLFIGCRDGQLLSMSEQGGIQSIWINNHHTIKKIIKIKDEIWIATDGNGIIILDNNLKFKRLLNRYKKNTTDLVSNSIYDIYAGNNNEVWIALYGAGLTCILPTKPLFENIIPIKGNENSLIANEGVSVSIYNDSFLLGTNYGLSIWDKEKNLYKNIAVEKLRSELNGVKVTATSHDDGNIWVATYDGCLGEYNKEFKLLRSYYPSSGNSAEMQQITTIKKITDSNLLLVTHFPNRFLLNFNIKQRVVEPFELYTKGSGNTYYLLNTLREDQKGELLAVISDMGLFRVNWKENVLKNEWPEANAKIDCTISDVYEDKKGYFWISSATDGLLKISKNGKELKKWSVKSGLPSNTLLRIESVDGRFLWISSIKGLCRFDTETEEIINFNHRDGLAANEFTERVSEKTKDGKIVFGSSAGFTLVDPTKVVLDTITGTVVISDITFQNKSIKDSNFLEKPLEQTNTLSLPFDKNSFTIHFFEKDKSYLKYQNFEYRLVGLEEDWIYLGETNHTTYTNLSPGSYLFEIKSSEFAKPTQLNIHIQTPWYISWYAYLIYATVFFVIISLFVYAYVKRIQLKNQKEISDYKIQKEHELTEKKIAFFTSVSHDLKTPLTLIDAPVKDLLRSPNLNKEQLSKLMVIQRNSKRLYKLITDILDFRKITQKQQVLEVKESNVSEFIEDIYLAFEEECKTKSITIIKSINENVIGFIDEKKLDKIVWNLLSNALKYTSNNGVINIKVEVLYKKSKEFLQLSISDNGVGIDVKYQSKIYERFYQVPTKNTINQEGSGIGLSIVKELVEIHHGHIKLESSIGEGACFTVSIPLDKGSYSDKEIVSCENLITQKKESISNESTEVIKEVRKNTQYNLPKLLIVEDNIELREYLYNHFARAYKIYVAKDGLAGLNQANKIHPDIILTDVQMPQMNGYEFCKSVRNQFETSHIPIVMLTSNSLPEHQIEGLSTGADAYITKPFDIELLDTSLSTVLANRKKLRNKFLGVKKTESNEKIIPQQDVQFINDLKVYIEANLNDSELNVEMLACYFAVSTSKLNRKVKSLLDNTPGNLIKSLRLKKAYQFLQNEDVSVAEVAYRVGFSDPNYFTSSFKREFGVNPSKIR